MAIAWPTTIMWGVRDVGGQTDGVRSTTPPARIGEWRAKMGWHRRRHYAGSREKYRDDGQH